MIIPKMIVSMYYLAGFFSLKVFETCKKLFFNKICISKISKTGAL